MRKEPLYPSVCWSSLDGRVRTVVRPEVGYVALANRQKRTDLYHQLDLYGHMVWHVLLPCHHLKKQKNSIFSLRNYSLEKEVNNILDNMWNNHHSLKFFCSFWLALIIILHLTLHDQLALIKFGRWEQHTIDNMVYCLPQYTCNLISRQQCCSLALWHK